MQSIKLTTIVRELSDGDDQKEREIACAIVRCINEGLVISNYPHAAWVTSEICDVTFRGFTWFENN